MARDPSQTKPPASDARMASPAIELTLEAQDVLQLWEHTRQHVFLTGPGRDGEVHTTAALPHDHQEAPGCACPHRGRGGQCPRSDHPCLLWVRPGYHPGESAASSPKKKAALSQSTDAHH